MPLPPSLSRAWFAVSDWVWPRACLACDAPLTEPAAVCLCSACVAAFTTDPHPACPRCASSVGPHTDLSAGCARCRNESYKFDSAVRLGVYDGVLRDAVLRVKRFDGDALAEALGTAFALAHQPRLLAGNPHCIVPVPLHWRRWWERGHNQAESVARGVAEVLKLPVFTRAVRRVRPTPMQTAVTAEERRRNVKGAFRPTPFARLQGLRVLLIDDVLTTGATADAAAEALRAGGAAQVSVAVLAHR